MKSHLLLGVALATVMASAVASCGSKATTAETVEADTLFVKPLSVKGKALVNADGDTMVLTGPSMGWHTNWGRFYSDSTVMALKQKWGANITRAAIGAHPSYDCQRAYSVDSAYAVDCAIALIDGAIANDMYVIADWHSHDNTIADAKEFFEVISSKYGDDPHIIYEIWNEPVEVTWDSIKAYAAEVIPVIRKNAPSSVIIIPTGHWDQDVETAAADPIQGVDNLLYNVHFYAGTHKEYLREKTQAAIDSGLPMIISECGSMSASGDEALDIESWNAWVELADTNNLTMLLWDIADKDESCSMLTPGAPSNGMQWTEENFKPWAKIAQETIKSRNTMHK